MTEKIVLIVTSTASFRYVNRSEPARTYQRSSKTHQEPTRKQPQTNQNHARTDQETSSLFCLFIAALTFMDSFAPAAGIKEKESMQHSERFMFVRYHFHQPTQVCHHSKQPCTYVPEFKKGPKKSGMAPNTRRLIGSDQLLRDFSQFLVGSWWVSIGSWQILIDSGRFIFYN